MSTLVSYKGLQVLDPEPGGSGGLAIQEDLKLLVDWHPRSVWDASSDPGLTEDEGADFHPGSLWRNASSGRLFRCVDASAGAAVWQPQPLLQSGDDPPKLASDLDLGGHGLITRGGGDLRLAPDAGGSVLLEGSTGLVLAGNAPLSGTPADSAGLYAEDVGGSTELFALDEAGNATQLSPHGGAAMARHADDPAVPFVYRSEQRFEGTATEVDLLKLARLVERLSGERVVEVSELPPERRLDWDDHQQRLRRRREAQIEAWEASDPGRRGPAPPPHRPKPMPAWLRERIARRPPPSSPPA